MVKESLRPSTGAKNILKKAFPLIRRLAVLTLVGSCAIEKYHEEPLIDKTPSEPAGTYQLDEWYFIQFSPITEIVQLSVQTPSEVVEIQAETNVKVGDFSEIAQIINLHPELFSKQDLEDLQVYFPIYAAVSEKYDLPWYLLWIIHKAESTVSRDPVAFESGRLHYGAMQRAVAFHFQENVDAASAGLEFLADFSQRHYDDWKEIAWAAAKLSEDRESTGSILGALLRYSSAESAQFRYQKFLQLSSIFDQ